MTHSMTAFARVERQIKEGIFCWEIKSVNHRYLDVSFRLPESFRFLEPSLRLIMRDKVSRGKLECQLKFQPSSHSQESLLINEKLVKDLLDTGHQLASTHTLANDLSLASILTWPGVIEFNKPNAESLSEDVETCFEQALAQLVAARKAEGEALREQIKLRLSKLNDEIKNSIQQAAAGGEFRRDKLITRLNSLNLEVDNARLEQELALLIARADVAEELDRLAIHVKEVANALNSKEASGRRLDFLMQELNREANTLSSKSDDIALTQRAIEMKVLIEQMREQIQNIE
ncbi:YicC/YloC family endoribonuclease [Legionella jordanis]|uniref:Putative stress-induced protein n=1 Tax=Legionella jordanis TaxID=456 RepID=A0A0W0VAU6_9GAMM|nr:YicC/YloC family endoribonuclease [Legionella jordanis]KTD16745.1 putative stress-induced protein [Legionella jordanis]RMX03727.1 YicC family protein [Legionella jordanis]RMX22211.1 YicC family protein [Legionella jordanis]VEH11787.1 putative stress-induced protein [Legionella jordanis]HAT8712903.1 YicC family protein [Legionella jordanis]